MRGTRLLVLLVALACGWVSATSAWGATAQIGDPPGDTGPSFETKTDLTSLRIAWDGRLTIQPAYQQIPPSGQLDLLVSSASEDEIVPNNESCDPDMIDSFSVTVRNNRAILQLPGVDGSLSADAQWSANTVTYSFSSPALSQLWGPAGGDPFACASGTADGDDFYGAFDGKIIKITPRTAADALIAGLGRRYGHASTAKIQARCPTEGLQAATQGDSSGPGSAARAFCAFEFRAGTTVYRTGSASVFLADGVPQITDLVALHLPASLRSCGSYPTTHNTWGPSPIFGAGVSVWAQRVPCSAARRLALHWNGKTRDHGYRCVVLRHGYESITVRCRRPGHRTVRWSGGA